MKKGDDTEAKRNVTLHILNCRLDFVCAGGEEGDTGFGAQLLETGSICCHIYQPGWFILKCLPGELGFVCK